MDRVKWGRAGERRRGAGGRLSLCSPGHVCLLLSVCTAWVAVCPCVSECPRAVERLGVLCVHVSVSVEYFWVHARPGGMCVYS